MKKDNWPLDPFKESEEEGQRGRWVQWAKRFQAVCSMVPGLKPERAKTVLMMKGGEKIWDILGNRKVSEVSFNELWQLIDRHYAVMGDPDTELRVYHR